MSESELETIADATAEVRGNVLMVQGTASDVGKSVIVTALCRIFTRDGFRTAPFKSQNMALNSYVTPDGKEIGRAQGIQADACGIAATTDMNPILLKPTGDMHSQIVVHGQPYRDLSAVSYRENFLPFAKPLVMDALGRLRQEYDIVVMEGAGSPAEINLKHRDIVNMNLAGWADAPVILVGDIDRGGVFAFLVGTLELLEPDERARVKGFIINKFRGDLSLLQPGLEWLEQRTGIPVLGVLPFMPNLEIEAEDSVVLDTFPNQVRSSAGQDLDIAVIRYPRISNFTDFDILSAEPDVSLRYVQKLSQLGDPDIVILPGSKDTIGDLEFMRNQRLDEGIRKIIEQRRHTRLVGICGGYQMLGNELHDPDAVEAATPRQAAGLGWLPVATTFIPGKTTVRVNGTTAPNASYFTSYSQGESLEISGYEIHSGRTVASGGGDRVIPVFRITVDRGAERDEGCITPDGRVFGTYLHGLFQNDAWRRAWLNSVRHDKGLPPLAGELSAASRKEAAFDRLADHVSHHLDIGRIYGIMTNE
ncbi:adenosylcobyric acid synthase (glutamine-hydrolysing) [Fontibacillus phaseoli]|uniref:Cobyric acid synthase n=1 Tax=Fontibacillus phaseoli TaxID=1416533 RepID=A0A369BFN5_9BACL|nr:cobyric acid synthase [Fontibacillus phaseoli]RCX20360.1 adenosylcobyric acid synthase (glutamine-hydrolysing) [Fontibacillus phaseoli]